MRSRVLTGGVLLFTAFTLGTPVAFLAQVQSDQKALAFEITSVKPAKSESVLQKGFSCSQEIVGGPAWIDDDLFDL